MEPESKASSSVSARSLPAPTFVMLACGLGLYLGWQTVGISPTLFPHPNAGVEQVLGSIGYYQTAIFLVLLVLLAAYVYKKGSLFKRKRLIILAALLTSASSVITYVCGWVLEVPSGVIVGSLLSPSKALLFLLWAECLCRIRIKDMLLCVSLAYAVVFVLCLLVAGLKPNPALITHSVLPLASGAFLLILRSDATFFALRESQIYESKPLKGLPLQLFIGIGMFGAIILFTNTLSESKSSATAELNTLLAGLVLSILIAVLAARRSEKLDLTFLYRMTAPLIIASVLIVLTLESGNQGYEAYIIGISWCFFRIFTWTLWGTIALRSRVPAACVFAVGQFALTACSTIAQFTVDNLIVIEDIPLPIMISAIIVLAVITSVFVISESDVRHFFGKGKSTRQPDNTEEAYAHLVKHAASEYGLSLREEEVTELVIKGKNNTVIQEQLCITESTLRTHLRNIYGKTSVHSRQELIALLHSYATEYP